MCFILKAVGGSAVSSVLLCAGDGGRRAEESRRRKNAAELHLLKQPGSQTALLSTCEICLCAGFDVQAGGLRPGWVLSLKPLSGEGTDRNMVNFKSFVRPVHSWTSWSRRVIKVSPTAFSCSLTHSAPHTFNMTPSSIQLINFSPRTENKNGRRTYKKSAVLTLSLCSSKINQRRRMNLSDIVEMSIEL